MNAKEMNIPEEVRIVKAVRVKAHSAETAVPYKPGDVVVVSGIDKVELLARKLAVKVTDEPVKKK